MYRAATIAAFLSAIASAQVHEEWVRLHEGVGGHCFAQAIAVDGVGNAYVTGNLSDSVADYDYGTVKYDSAGVEQWVRRYNGPGNDIDDAVAIVEDGAGNVFVTGYSRDSVTSYDYCTIKYSSAGVEQWVRRYNGPENRTDYTEAMAMDSAGNVYITGASYSVGTLYDYCTIKYSSAGVEQWVRRYNGPGSSWDWAYAIAVDGAGNVYVTGESGNSDTIDYCTVKYNTNGVQQWALRYNGPANSIDRATAIAVDGAGNVYVTGESDGTDTMDYCTIKYSTAGVQQWALRYNGPGSSLDRATAIAVDGAGNAYVTGYSRGAGTGTDYCTIKYSTGGVQEWVRRYDGPGSFADDACAISVDSAGSAYVTGASCNSSAHYDYCTVKYSSAGVERWTQRYSGPGTIGDLPVAIAVDVTGGVYVTGGSLGSDTVYDYCTIKYSQDGGTQPSLSGTVYDISVNFAQRTLDSTGRSAGALVSLYQGGTLRYGPVLTGTGGAYSFANVAAGTFELRVSKVISLPPGLNPPKSKDTVLIKTPVTVGADETKDLILPVLLTLQKYQLIKALQTLPNPECAEFPQWGIRQNRTFSYNETGIQGLVDAWTSAGMTADQRAALERLVIVEKCVQAVYDDGGRLGAEMLVTLSELVFSVVELWRVADAVYKLSRGVPGFEQCARAFLGLIVSATEGITRAVLDGWMQGLPQPDQNLMKVALQGAFATVKGLVREGPVVPSAVGGVVVGYLGQPIVQEGYISRTQPCLDLARLNAEANRLNGSFPSALGHYVQCDSFVASAVSRQIVDIRRRREGCNLISTIGTLTALAGSGDVSGIYAATAILIKGIAVLGYKHSLSILYDGLTNWLPGELNPEGNHIFQPGAYDGLPGGFPATLLYLDGPSMPGVLTGFDSWLDSLEAAATSSDTAAVRSLLLGMAGAKIDLMGQVNADLYRANSQALVGLESLPGYQEMSDSAFAGVLGLELNSASVGLMASAYVLNPVAEYRDSLLSLISQTRLAILYAGSVLGQLRDSLDRFYAPPNCHVRSKDYTCVADTGDVVTLTMVVANSGDSTALDVTATLSVKPGLELMGDSMVTIGTLGVGGCDTVAWTVRAVPYRERVAGWALMLRSTNAVAFSTDGVIMVQQPERIWREVASVPAGAAGKSVKAGGAVVAGEGYKLYALKGNRTREFYRYDVLSEAWAERCSMPAGTSGKPVKAGAALCFDGNNLVYALKGNNTREFWQYDVAADRWAQLPDVPSGTSTAGIKYGSGLAFETRGDSSFVFCAPGSKTRDFFAYWVEGDTWLRRPDIPAGASGKPMKKGSCLASDGLQRVYALKSYTNEFFCYNVAAGSWQTLETLNMSGARLKRAKVKDGGSLACDLSGQVWAMKGGNCQEVWVYSVEHDRWLESDSVPRGPSSRRVKNGSGLCYAQGHLYALKGNNTREFWQYSPCRMDFGSLAGGGQAGRPARVRYPLELATGRPNPFRRQSQIAYSLPAATGVTLSVHDAAGRLVKTLVDGNQPAGRHSATWNGTDEGGRAVPRGIYFCTLDAAGKRLQQKLVLLK